jgi:hypothetical protein
MIGMGVVSLLVEKYPPVWRKASDNIDVTLGAVEKVISPETLR